jgi:hypothetical protein
MEVQDLVDFLEDSKNIVLLPADEKFPFDIGDIVFTYTTKQNIDWVTFSLYFQREYANTTNVVDIIEKNNGKIDFKFQANSQHKTVDIVATDLNYNKEKFDIFVSKFKSGDHLNMRFNCWKEQDEMEQTMAIDPTDQANQPIHITRLNLFPLGTSSGD